MVVWHGQRRDPKLSSSKECRLASEPTRLQQLCALDAGGRGGWTAKRSGTSSRHRHKWSLLTNLTQETTAERRTEENVTWREAPRPSCLNTKHESFGWASHSEPAVPPPSNRGSSESVPVNPDVDVTAHTGVCTHLCSSHLSQINIIIARDYKGQRSIFLLFSFPTSDLSLISASLHYLCLRGFWEQHSASLSPAGIWGWQQKCSRDFKCVS